MHGGFNDCNITVAIDFWLYKWDLILIVVLLSNRSLCLIYLKMFIKPQLTGLPSDLLKHLGLLYYGHWIAFSLTLQAIKALPRDQRK